MGSVDYTSVREKIKNLKKLENLVDKKVQNGVEEAKNNFIEQFEEHPVTKEIQNGPEASNESGTLNGQGNLFSFIGFERGSNPIAPVASFLKNAFQIKKLKTEIGKSKIIINYKVSCPTQKNISLCRKSSSSWI